MADWAQFIVTSLVTLAASSGFWAYVVRRLSMKTSTKKLLLGLAYDKLATLGIQYIQRGTITRDEYEEYVTGLYEPYIQCGGNGVGKRIMEAVSALPLTSHDQYTEIGNQSVTPSSRDK